uniref:hypothetical protein n=1 Tax=Enterocloster clostridioformis TaxID=1531 RepID=UPI003A90D3BC
FMNIPERSSRKAIVPGAGKLYLLRGSQRITESGDALNVDTRFSTKPEEKPAGSIRRLKRHISFSLAVNGLLCGSSNSNTGIIRENMKIRSAAILRSAGFFTIKAGMLRNIILAIIREGSTVGSKDSAPTAGLVIRKIFSVITEEKSTKEICRLWKTIQ